MIINGNKIAAEIEIEISQIVAALDRKPCLAMVLVGDHPPSQIYVSRKKNACERVGIKSKRLQLPENIQEAALLEQIRILNDDPNIDGILVQLPLPPQINPFHVILQIDQGKDVDGLHPMNAGKLLIGDQSGFVPCTPLGVKVLLQRSKIETSGKEMVILGRSNLVGKPLAALMVQNLPGANATVTIVHSQSKNVSEICQRADILVAAIGKPKFVTEQMVKKNAVVIDVGISKINGTVMGDVDFETVSKKCAAITPVPGGVGPMTIAMLLSNTLKAAESKNV